MELDLQRTVLEGHQLILDTVLSQENTAESIVPDSYPDVSRIIRSDGNGYITMTQAGSGSAKVLGTTTVQILYVPEGESIPRALTLDIPFQCTVDHPQMKEDTQIHVSMLSATADTRPINPRKLLIRAEVKLLLHAYGRESREVTCDLACENNALQKQLQTCDDHSLSAVLEKPFSFSDILRQSSSKPHMDEILMFHGEPGTTEAKYIGRKLVCKGELLLSLLYRSGQDIVPAKFELPFSQVLDLECGCDEGEAGVTLALKQLNCMLQEGDLEVSVEALLQAELWSHRPVTFLHDMYSTAAPLDLDRGTCMVCITSETGSRRESGRQFCESGIPAKQVLDCKVTLGAVTNAPQAGNAKCSADAAVDILYLSEDDALCCVSYTVPMSCEIGLQDGCKCRYTCRPVGEGTAVPVTGGFEVRLECEFIWRITCMQQVQFVTAANEKKGAEVHRRPSLVIRRVGAGESLWDIAKACSATIPDICSANALTMDCAEPGAILLIPASR